MRVGRATALHFSSQVTRSLAGFVGTLVIARVLGASGLGAYAIVVAFTTWLTIPTTAIARATNKRVSEGRDPGATLGAGVLALGAASVILVGAMFALGDPISTYVGRDIASLVVPLFLATAAYNLVTEGLKGGKRVGLAGILDAVEQVLRTVLQVGLLVAGYAVVGLVAGHATALLAVAALGIVLLTSHPAVPGREDVRHLLSFARYNWLNVFQTRSFAWMDTIVLAFFVAPALVGIYEVAWRLASVLGLVTISVQQALFPEMSDLGARGELDRVKHFLDEGLVYTGLFVIPGLVGAAVVGPRVLRIYRPEFTQGSGVLLILIGARIARAYGSPFVNAINAIDRPDIAFRIDLTFVVSNLVLNVLLVIWIGWYGAAIATAVSTVLTVLLGYVALRGLVGALPLPLAAIGQQVGASLVMGGVIWASTLALPPNSYVTVAQVLLGALVYSGVLLVISARVRGKAVALASTSLA